MIVIDSKFVMRCPNCGSCNIVMLRNDDMGDFECMSCYSIFTKEFVEQNMEEFI